MPVFHRSIWKVGTSAVLATVAATVMWVSAASADPSFPSTVTISVRPAEDGKYIASGALKTPKEGCRVTRSVVIWRKVSGPDQKRADARTDSDGNWVARGARLEPGTYYAKVEKDRRGHPNTGRYFCLADRSPDVTAG